MSRHGMAITMMPRSKGIGWFGDGRDGAVTISSDTSLPVDEDTGVIIKQYKSLTINSGRTLTAAHRCNAMVLLVQGDLTINGTISMNKLTSFINDKQTEVLMEPHISMLRHACKSATGALPRGGAGGNGGSYYNIYSGGTGGVGHSEGGGMGGGGGAYRHSDVSDEGRPGANGDRPTHGQIFPVIPSSDNNYTSTYGSGGSTLWSTFEGGAGPGGSGAYWYAREYSSTQTGYYGVDGVAGDAYGGGAIYIVVGGNIKIGSTGSIVANGGNGGGGTGRVPSGGGGGGGIICMTCVGTYTSSGSVQANGGSAGQSGYSYLLGTNGENGTVFVSQFANLDINPTDYSAWFGNGALGDVVISSNTELPVAQDAQLVTQYRNLTINSGCTLKPQNRCNGWVMLVQNDLIVNGSISMNKMAPLVNSNEGSALSESHVALVCANVIGGDAGSCGVGYSDGYERHGSYRSGGEPGKGFLLGGGFASGSGYELSYSVVRHGGDSEPRPPMGSLPSVAPTTGDGTGVYGSGASCINYDGELMAAGGKGPGGSSADYISTSFSSSGNVYYAGVDGDGYPGGLLVIFVGGRLIIGENGSISADGGDGADGVYATNSGYTLWGAPAGGAGGGIIAVIYNQTSPEYASNSVHASGGNGGALGPNPSQYAAPGENGHDGTVIVAPVSVYA